MAVSSYSLMSLAYLIEVSFAINLAYHELNTFKLRNRLQRESNEVLGRHIRMWGDRDTTLVQPEWDHLTKFHTGNRAAWENNLLGWFYGRFVYTGLDRRIVRYILVILVALLMFGTYFSSEDNKILWLITYWVLIASIVIPPIFMWLVRLCTIYAFGCVEEESDNDKKEGRLKALDQLVLGKIKALISQVTPNQPKRE